MHYHNLYRAPKDKTATITNLARHFGGRAALPGTDEILQKLCRKCTRIINTSVREWKDKGMLVATGGGGGGWVRKSPALTKTWNHYKDAFQLLELQCNSASGGHIGRAKVRLFAISLRATLITRTENG
jgi:hypothetical protein